VIYGVSHRTTFTYEDIVSVSQHVLHLSPRAHPRQQCIGGEIIVTPSHSHQSTALDYYGNPTSYLTIQEAHQQLVVESRFRVEVYAETRQLQRGSDAAWESVVQAAHSAEAGALDASEYVFDSPYIAGGTTVRDFAAQSFPAGRSLLDAVAELTARIYEEFEYRGGVSDVSTPVQDVLAMRQGVCQDFAHLEIACLRSLGLPARYVSGYLLTHPPAGQPKLAGADASHAWISVWSRDYGWVDFDPTNNLIPDLEHITIAWGRDYGDVSPINGFVVGGGAHQLAVAVDVVPMQ
jgi:transglutaminase-like putative cysteine protease